MAGHVLHTSVTDHAVDGHILVTVLCVRCGHHGRRTCQSRDWTFDAEDQLRLHFRGVDCNEALVGEVLAS